MEDLVMTNTKQMCTECPVPIAPFEMAYFDTARSKYRHEYHKPGPGSLVPLGTPDKTPDPEMALV